MRAEGEELLAHLREELTELRAIHHARGTYYSEPTMQQLDAGRALNATRGADLTPPSSPVDAAHDLMVAAEIDVLITIVDQELTPSGRQHTARLRELLNLPPRGYR